MNRPSLLRRVLASAAATAVPLRAVAQSAKLRVAMVPNDAGAGSAYAYEMGFFAKAGVKVMALTDHDTFAGHARASSAAAAHGVARIRR